MCISFVWPGIPNMGWLELIGTPSVGILHRSDCKVRTFWEAHKNLRNLPSIKSMRKIFWLCCLLCQFLQCGLFRVLSVTMMLGQQWDVYVPDYYSTMHFCCSYSWGTSPLIFVLGMCQLFFFKKIDKNGHALISKSTANIIMITF